MKSLAGLEQRQVYSDSDDEQCTVKDVNEEKATSALATVSTLKAAEIFVTSPKAHGEDGKGKGQFAARATQLIQFDKLETSKKNPVRPHAMEIKTASGRALRAYQRPLFTEDAQDDETCVAADDSADDGRQMLRKPQTTNSVSFSGASRKGGRVSRVNTQQTGQDMSDAEVKRATSQLNQLYSASVTNLDFGYPHNDFPRNTSMQASAQGQLTPNADSFHSYHTGRFGAGSLGQLGPSSSQRNSNLIQGSNEMSHKLSVTDASFDNGPQNLHQQVDTSGFDDNQQSAKDFQRQEISPYF